MSELPLTMLEMLLRLLVGTDKELARRWTFTGEMIHFRRIQAGA